MLANRPTDGTDRFYHSLQKSYHLGNLPTECLKREKEFFQDLRKSEECWNNWSDRIGLILAMITVFLARPHLTDSVRDLFTVIPLIFAILGLGTLLIRLGADRWSLYRKAIHLSYYLRCALGLTGKQFSQMSKEDLQRDIHDRLVELGGETSHASPQESILICRHISRIVEVATDLGIMEEEDGIHVGTYEYLFRKQQNTEDDERAAARRADLKTGPNHGHGTE